ncbi:hypothetical protein [Streptomyces chattanoogensis]|uniref:hypothetical protein n=1 Tax=Streptomyces chattanoogensis TaxID=66876 RepID=UPI0036754FE8
MRKAVRRIAAATGVLVAGAALPLVVTAPAQATTKACESYLASKGYVVGPKADQACSIAGSHQDATTDLIVCSSKLMFIGVKSADSGEACFRGAQ